MTKSLTLHIPHSSDKIPFFDGFVVGEDYLKKEILKLTDWHTEDLFESEEDDMIVANFSRVFCDPERFSDDEQEVMSKVGMGVLYEKGDDGTDIRLVNKSLREKILNEYYHPHHSLLSASVNRQLSHRGEAVIIDCHSYPSVPFIRDLSQTPNRPDFNIGIDSFHTPNELKEKSIQFFRDKGFSLGIDQPYSGTIVPMEHYKKNKEVKSIMLEINRGLYLVPGTNQKSDNYFQIKEVVKEFIELIRD